MATGVLLNTRPARYRARFHAAFSGLGWPIIECPLLAPTPIAAVLPLAEDFDALIFTSQVAVALFDDDPVWRRKKVFAVGAKTAEAARAAGFADTVQTGRDGADLAAHLSTAPFERALYPSAEDVSIDLAQADRQRIRRVPIYRMEPRNHLPGAVVDAAKRQRIFIVPLFSRRSTATLADLLAKAGLTAANARIWAVGISGKALPDAAGPWQRRAVADKPTLEAVAAKVREMAADVSNEARA